MCTFLQSVTVDSSLYFGSTWVIWNPESILLDVRTPEEYADGFIKGAINTPHTDTKKILASVSKDDTIILYCRSGRRVGLVAEMLNKKGYQNIYHLDGDIKEWIARGKPLEKP